MKYAILLFIVAYFVWGIRIAVLSFKETMAGIPNIARSGTYKLGAQIGAYFSFLRRSINRRIEIRLSHGDR